ncbi:MAG: peptidase U32 [Alphaproteobacteria bacterium]|jgi:U32 family peptidase|nr:peptidase U32 [Alphaproteobacteria bacterium]
MNQKRLRSELLAPAGSLNKLKTAISYGADAVYIGTPDLSLRTKSQITLEDLTEGIKYAHKYGKKVYLTLNLFSHNRDIEKLPKFLETINEVKPDGIIVADPGIFQYLKERTSDIELHISTQANICSWLSVKYWQDQGADLCVMARETSFEEIKEVKEKCPNIKIETFIHGAMCMTYSGRCLLSNFMSERGANQGNCAHSCRWHYKLHLKLRDGSIKELEINEENQNLFEFLLEEEYRPGEFMPLEEDLRGSYILNAKDLCLMPKLNEYLESGIDSLKIEGRNKSEYYLAITTRAYRKAMDDWALDPENWQADKYLAELDTLSNRGYSLAFHEGRLTNYGHNYESAKSATKWEFAGIINEIADDHFILEVKNRLVAGDVLEFVPPAQYDPILLRLYNFNLVARDENGEDKLVEVVNPGFKPKIKIFYKIFEQEDQAKIKMILQENTVVRKEKPLTQEEFERLKLDLEARKLEDNKGSEQKFKKLQEQLIHTKTENLENIVLKTPRVGTEGCCGKGCNGCLMFWHDEKYSKARALLKQKKMGQMLTTAEANIAS